MVNSWYPSDLKEALKLKKEHPEAVIYAGGTDLMVAKKELEGLLFIHHLAELKVVKVTKYIANEKKEGKEIQIEIGAASVYHDLIRNPLIPDLLKRAMKEIASPAIRNVATIGGNICNASPAGDTLPILYLFDAKIVAVSLQEEELVERIIPIEDFILGIRKIDLQPTEIVTKILIPIDNVSKNVTYGYKKVGARKAQAISKLLFAATIIVEEGIVKDFRVAYGSVGITVLRRKEIEARYRGSKFEDFMNNIPEVLHQYEECLKPIDDQRSTAVYRKKVCLNLLEDFLRNQNRRIIITNGTIIDGSNQRSFQGDILIENKKIIAIEAPGYFMEEVIEEAKESAKENIREGVRESIRESAQVIDATGLVVSPGFIDTHSHSDLKVLIEPEVMPKLMQGITTEVLGQDGISMAPLPIPHISAWRKNIAGLDGESSEINWNFETTSNYLNLIEEAKPAVNESYLLPHGNVRMEAMGLDDREPTEEEIKKMCQITRREMEAGCLGLSSGLIYMPCAYSKTKELIEICKVVKEYEGVFVVHQRSEADTIVTSMEEIVEIGRQSGVNIHFSHFKVCGKKNWKYLDAMFKILDRAEQEGIKVSFDQYPYVAGSTMLGVILPPWVHDGGTDQLVERLKSVELREKMKKDIKEGIPGWDNFIDFAGVEGIFITSVVTDKNKDAVGLSLSELGAKKGIDPLDAAFDLLMEEQNAVGMVDFYGLEDHVKRIMKRKEMNVCTDGLLAGTPHPRVYGSFPRVLGKYVREENVLSIEEAVYKMTGKAADALGIRERGELKNGYYADIAIWNPDTILDKGTFEQPKQFPEGMEYVIVNGEIAIEHGKYTGERNGMVLRK